MNELTGGLLSILMTWLQDGGPSVLNVCHQNGFVVVCLFWWLSFLMDILLLLLLLFRYVLAW